MFQRTQDYAKGAAVTFRNAMWIATTATSDEPGTSADWQLALRGKGS
ncbi:MAG TPA: hypothetical protein VFL78_11725 [Rhodanobacteraceae bacterium]|nr:hypothetical protein [Rhodanobacteraceae bacterium]